MRTRVHAHARTHTHTHTHKYCESKKLKLKKKTKRKTEARSLEGGLIYPKAYWALRNQMGKKKINNLSKSPTQPPSWHTKGEGRERRPLPFFPSQSQINPYSTSILLPAAQPLPKAGSFLQSKVWVVGWWASSP